jgi:hypothetical protein
MNITRPTFHRRDLIRTSAAGGLLASCLDVSANEAADGNIQHASDLVRGIVPRTGGKLACGGKVFQESAREVQVAGECGVLVCGGGPAGVAAALAAARAGADVTLLEVAGCLGGIWTCGLLTKILDAGNKQGIMAELLREFAQKGSQVAKSSKGTVYDPEVAKLVLEELLVGAGVRILYHTRIVGAVKDANNRISVVLTESKAGRQAWRAARYVDCTGDGDLAAQAGCQFDVGTGQDCTCQPMSMLALLTGIDPEEVKPYVRETNSKSKPLLLKVMEDAGIHPSYRGPTLRHLHSGIFSIMTNHEYGVPAFDNQAVTDATIRARKEIHAIVEGLRKVGGPWKDLAIVATAEQIGIREGRRIRGRYEVDFKDLAKGLRHEQAVCRATFPIDVHALGTTENKEVDHTFAKAGLKPYDIPYPALVSADVDGLLMAGRCISGDFIAHSSYRVTGNSVALGEAAGLAAAVSLSKGKMPHELDWREIRPS